MGDIQYTSGNIDTGPANYYIESSNLSGTVQLTASTKVLAGTSTKFLTELSVGQTIFITKTGVTTEYVIATITSDTNATVVAAAADIAAGATLTALYNVGGTKGGVRMDMETSTYEKTIDQLGDTPISEVIRGRKCKVTVNLAEVSPKNWGRIMADSLGYKTSTGKEFFRTSPSVGLDLMTLARKHRIIPLSGQNNVTDINKIITFWACAPSAETLSVTFDPATQRTLEAKFTAYPDPTTGEFWYVGDRTA